MSDQKPNLILQTLDSFFTVGIAYLKGQLILFFVNFCILTLALWLFGMPLPFLIALAICILDLFPVVGSGLVFVPWSIVCFATARGTLGLQLALLYIGMVILRQILEPLIIGRQIGLSPLWTLAASLAGLWLLGGFGIFVGPVIAAVFASVYRLRCREAAKRTEIPVKER